MAILSFLAQPVAGEGKVARQDAGKKVPPVLAMEIHEVAGGMEAEFTNHTTAEVGVKVGKQLIKLKPGESAGFPIQKQEKLNIYEKFRKQGKNEWRHRAVTFIFPRAGKAEFLRPR